MGIRRIYTLDVDNTSDIARKCEIDAIVICGFIVYGKQQLIPLQEEFQFLDGLVQEFPQLPRYYVCPGASIVLQDLVWKKYKTPSGGPGSIISFLETINE